MAKNTNFFDKNEIYDSKEFKQYVLSIHKQIIAKSRSVINDFYNHYTPVIYRRGYGLKDMFHASMKRIPDGYELIYIYSSDYFTSSHRDDAAAFTSAFVEGYHGGPLAWGKYPRKNDPKMTPSPWESLIEFFYSI